METTDSITILIVAPSREIFKTRVTSMVLSPDGTHILFTKYNDQNIYLCNVQPNTEVVAVTGPVIGEGALAVAFVQGNSGLRVASASACGTVQL
jgi:hypothetical protein